MDFTNPVLNADWPDPDALRVGDDYDLVASSFNPAPDWLSLDGDGALRLRVLPDDVGDPRLLPRVLGQPLPGRPSEWTTSLTLGPSTPGTRAGLVVLGEARCDAEGTITFTWRTQGAWCEVDTRFPASAGRWIGADIGLFAAAPLGTQDGGDHVTFGPVSVDLDGVEEVAA